ncbi:hypothetical protein FRB96_007112 [Tulasnella sp. 330]|nr:hypothetical protein FRB96_007112 [Tulasnella sp. 330]
MLIKLPELKDQDHLDPWGATMRGRLTEKLEDAREEIKTPANTIDKYAKTKFIERFEKRKKGIPGDAAATKLENNIPAVTSLLQADETLFSKEPDAQTAQFPLAMDRSATRDYFTTLESQYEEEEPHEDADKIGICRSRPSRGVDLGIRQLEGLHPETRGHASILGVISILQWVPGAIDKDGSGWVSTNEVNEFTREKLKGMNLGVWLAYWAAGWDINSHAYKKKARDVIQQMRGIPNLVLDDNKNAVKNIKSSRNFRVLWTT